MLLTAWCYVNNRPALRTRVCVRFRLHMAGAPPTVGQLAGIATGANTGRARDNP